MTFLGATVNFSYLCETVNPVGFAVRWSEERDTSNNQLILLRNFSMKSNHKKP